MNPSLQTHKTIHHTARKKVAKCIKQEKVKVAKCIKLFKVREEKAQEQQVEQHIVIGCANGLGAFHRAVEWG